MKPDRLFELGISVKTLKAAGRGSRKPSERARGLSVTAAQVHAGCKTIGVHYRFQLGG